MSQPDLVRLSLAELADVPAQEIPAALGAIAGVQTVLAARLTASASNSGAEPAMRTLEPPDRLLSAKEAAERLGMSRRWLYARASKLPFARRVSEGAVRFSERGLEKWQAGRRP